MCRLFFKSFQLLLAYLICGIRQFIQHGAEKSTDHTLLLSANTEIFYSQTITHFNSNESYAIRFPRDVEARGNLFSNQENNKMKE